MKKRLLTLYLDANGVGSRIILVDTLLRACSAITMATGRRGGCAKASG